ncbi:MAG: ParB/RepB/Spo0J family partition protein [Cyanobacteria bacterium J06635_15]
MSRNGRQTLDSALANEFVFGSDERSQSVDLPDEISELKAELNRLKSKPKESSTLLPIDKIVPLRLPAGMKQPRKYFDPVAMGRLQASISKHGVCEPILTRPAEDGFWEIVSGERRWRSASALGLTEIPGVTKSMSDEEALEIALVAHLLSENITSIEETDSLLGLISLRTGLVAAEIPGLLTKVRNAQVRKSDYSGIITSDLLGNVESILSEFGISLASFVSNRLPLLDLPDFIMESVRQGKVDPSKAVLVARTKPEFQEQLMDELLETTLTKEQLRKRIADLKFQGAASPSVQIEESEDILEQPTFSSVQKLYSKLNRKLKGKEVPMNRKVQVRINRIDVALRELLAELD